MLSDVLFASSSFNLFASLSALSSPLSTVSTLSVDSSFALNDFSSGSNFDRRTAPERGVPSPLGVSLYVEAASIGGCLDRSLSVQLIGCAAVAPGKRGLIVLSSTSEE